MIYSGDWAWSVPGNSRTVLWKYLLGGLLVEAVRHDRWVLPHQPANQFPGVEGRQRRRRLALTGAWDTKTYNVYRAGDLGTPHGHAVCASLQQLGARPARREPTAFALRAIASANASGSTLPHKRKCR